MVDDMQTFAAALRAHRYVGLSLVSQVYPDEDHLTLPPLFFTRGLLWVLGTPEMRAP